VIVPVFIPGMKLPKGTSQTFFPENRSTAATVPHGWTNITDHVDYLSVRPDPDRVLPAGYMNPAIKK